MTDSLLFMATSWLVLTFLGILGMALRPLISLAPITVEVRLIEFFYTVVLSCEISLLSSLIWSLISSFSFLSRMSSASLAFRLMLSMSMFLVVVSIWRITFAF